jgi:hypothetical protein
MLLLVTCVAVGAIINIAVAWSLTIRNDAHGISFQTDSTAIDADHAAVIWKRYAPSAAHEQAGKGVQLRRLGVVECVVYPKSETPSPSDGAPNVACEWRFGWPFPTLRTGAHASQPERFHDAWVSQLECNALGLHQGQRLPAGPVWSGFVINTIFYAAILWLMIRGPAETRRRWRELRGNRGRCGYPRRMTNGAPG